MTKNQVILITGTSRGIGKHLAAYYSQKGFKVIGCSRSPVDYSFKDYQHFCLDVCDEDKVGQMFGEIRKTYNRLDVLINNAGAMTVNYAMLTPVESAQRIMNTNFIGTFLFCREAAKIMQRKQYGRIVNISTIAVPLSIVGNSIYSASKAAIEQFSKVLSKEVAPYGITVNTLALSFVKDSGMAKGIDEKAVREAMERTVLKSWLDTEDVVNAIDFFISPKSTMITNQTLYLGGI
jgi:3-oxoacyl-[acyl-carrier protein] reductase